MENNKKKDDVKEEKEIDQKESSDPYNSNDKAGPTEQAPKEQGGSGSEETPRER